MERKTVRFVRFFAPGSFVANDWTVNIDTLDPAAVKWPDNAYSFSLHERIDVLDGGETYTGAEKQIGPEYWHPDSRIETLSDIERRNDPRDRILLTNMRCNGWNEVVRSRWGNWSQPFDPKTCKVLRDDGAAPK